MPTGTSTSKGSEYYEIKKENLTHKEQTKVCVVPLLSLKHLTESSIKSTAGNLPNLLALILQ